MLRVIFTEGDLARVVVAASPDPCWEITNSLDRLQHRSGRWAYAQWYRRTRAELHSSGFESTVRSLLLPLFPRAAYFPDFLTPAEAAEGLAAGVDAILAAPAARVEREIRTLARYHRTPSWALRIASPDLRAELASALHAYHDLVIQPCGEVIQTVLDADRALRARALLDGGVEQLLRSYRPMMRWNPPVLEVDYPIAKTLRLDGSGLRLVPSYFCWKYPVALADPTLSPVLIYPVLSDSTRIPERPHAPTAALLGATRAAVLRATATGATTSEIARAAGISGATASHHLTVLRDSRLTTSHRQGTSVFHVLTPLGAALLAPAKSQDMVCGHD